MIQAKKPASCIFCLTCGLIQGIRVFSGSLLYLPESVRHSRCDSKNYILSSSRVSEKNAPCTTDMIDISTKSIPLFLPFSPPSSEPKSISLSPLLADLAYLTILSILLLAVCAIRKIDNSVIIEIDRCDQIRLPGQWLNVTVLVLWRYLPYLQYQMYFSWNDTI